MSTLFISIAAYRDPELLPTLRNCLEMAANPEDLRICVAWQHSNDDEWDTLDEYKEDPRFEIIDIPHRQSKGVCWARHEIQKRYAGETYYLQLDSHHRFRAAWDESLKDFLHYLQATGNQKPLLSAYLPPYFPEEDPAGRTEDVYSLNIDRFLPEGIAFLGSHKVPNWKQLVAPFPGRFVSAHFIFTLGPFALEVPYDPELYFHGEESSIAVRAYTHGYNLFSPHRPIIWHEYHRQGKARHWEDEPNWSQRNKTSYARYRQLFGVDDSRTVGHGFGFGGDRTLNDYERYAGILFSERRIHQETLNQELPPIKSDLYVGLSNQIKICIDVLKDSLSERDYDFFAVALLDKMGSDIHREDCTANEIQSLLHADSTDRFIHIHRTFYHYERPSKSRVWPHSRSKGWTDRIEQVIPND